MNGGVILMGQMEAGEPLVPNRVRELRENKLMTQAQLARKAKVALRTIHSVEKGMNCRMDTKRKILLALGKRRGEPLDQILGQKWRIARYRGDQIMARLCQSPMQTGKRPGKTTNFIRNHAEAEQGIAVDILVGIDQHFIHLRR